VQRPCIEYAVWLKRLDILTEAISAVGVYERPRLQSNEFFACIAVHLACRRIRLDHEAGMQIVDNQTVIGGIENASILPFFFFWWTILAFFHEDTQWPGPWLEAPDFPGSYRQLYSNP
jgi:hypothetical protein